MKYWFMTNLIFVIKIMACYYKIIMHATIIAHWYDFGHDN